MNTFEKISAAVRAWDVLSKNITDVQAFFSQDELEFIMTKDLQTNATSDTVNVYFGIESGILYTILIDAEKDIEDRYTNDLAAIMDDMVIIPATKVPSGTVHGTNTSTPSSSSAEIPSSEAIPSIAKFNNATARLATLNSLLQAPWTMEVPKESLLVSNNKSIYFGIKTAVDEELNGRDVWDFVVKKVNNSGPTPATIYFDRVRPVPPYTGKKKKSLCHFLDI